MSRASITRGAIAAALLVAAGACGTDGPTDPMAERAPDTRLALAWDARHEGATGVYVCKISWEAFTGTVPDNTTGKDFDFEVTINGGTPTVYEDVKAQTFAGRDSELCILAYDGPAGAQVVVREIPTEGSALISWYTESGFLGNIDSSPLGSMNLSTRTWTYTSGEGNAVAIVSFKNTQEDIPEGEGCTYTIGYWKTHSELGPAPYDPTWALLPSGASTPFFLSGQTWFEAFWTPVGGNQYYNLAHQFMGSVLNLLDGATAPGEVVDALSQAVTLFNSYTPAQIAPLKGNDSTRKQFVSLAGTLASYNEGAIGPGHCDSETVPQ